MPLEEWALLDPVKFIIENENPATLIIIKIHSNRCGTCSILTPFFLDQMVKNEAYARWMQVDVGKVPGCTSYFNVKRVPTFIAIKNKLEVGRYVGSRRHSLERFVQDMIKEYGRLKTAAEANKQFEGFKVPVV